jgi:hypothetical protein
MQEHLAVSFRPREDAVLPLANLEARAFDRARDVGYGRGAQTFVANDAACSIGLLTADLELRLHERYERTALTRAVGYGGHELGEADERGVDDGDIRRAPDGLRCERSRVGSLHNDDTGVDAELVRELAVAHVHRDHRCGAALQEAIGKASGGCAQIEATASVDLDAKRVERSGELDSAPRNIGRGCAANFDDSVVRDERSCLVDALTVDEHIAREHHAEGLGTRQDELPGHE